MIMITYNLEKRHLRLFRNFPPFEDADELEDYRKSLGSYSMEPKATLQEARIWLNNLLPTFGDQVLKQWLHLENPEHQASINWLREFFHYQTPENVSYRGLEIFGQLIDLWLDISPEMMLDHLGHSQRSDTAKFHYLLSRVKMIAENGQLPYLRNEAKAWLLEAFSSIGLELRSKFNRNVGVETLYLDFIPTESRISRHNVPDMLQAELPLGWKEDAERFKKFAKS